MSNPPRRFSTTSPRPIPPPPPPVSSHPDPPPLPPFYQLLTSLQPPTPTSPAPISLPPHIYLLTLEQTSLVMDIDNTYTTKTLHWTANSALEALGVRVAELTAQFGEGATVDAATGVGFVVPGKVVLRIGLVGRRVG